MHKSRESIDEQQASEQFTALIELNNSGWAGIMPGIGIVDRRRYPEAMPVQKNSMLGIPEPKVLPEWGAFDYENDEFGIDLINKDGRLVERYKEGGIGEVRARQLMFEYNKRITSLI